MAKTTAWDTYMKRAAAQLSRARAETAEEMSGGQTGVREIRELAGAMKELTALRVALSSPEKCLPRDAVQVSFDEEDGGWRA